MQLHSPNFVTVPTVRRVRFSASSVVCIGDTGNGSEWRAGDKLLVLHFEYYEDTPPTRQRTSLVDGAAVRGYGTDSGTFSTAVGTGHLRRWVRSR